MIVKTKIPVKYRGIQYTSGEVFNAGWKLGPGLVARGLATRVKEVPEPQTLASTEYTVQEALKRMRGMSDEMKNAFAKDDERKTIQKELKDAGYTKEDKSEYTTK